MIHPVLFRQWTTLPVADHLQNVAFPSKITHTIEAASLLRVFTHVVQSSGMIRGIARRLSAILSSFASGTDVSDIVQRSSGYQEDVKTFPDGSVIVTALANIRAVQTVYNDANDQNGSQQRINTKYLLKGCISGHVPWDWQIRAIVPLPDQMIEFKQ